MGDIMRPIPFHKLMNWIIKEKEQSGTIFGIDKIYRKENEDKMPIFGTELETPVGPAAGPHTQLAQNIIAAYVAGGRFFELKTVQIMDGEELSACIAKPCIDARDEGYNTEWSTELTVPQAFDEYVKAWFALKLISKEFNLGDPDGFIFNISVGYDFAGITSSKIDTYIEGMMEAKETDIFKECKEFALSHLDLFRNVDQDYVEQISSKVSNSITVSTLHGCPPSEIEKIASYLIDKKGLHTFVKCNPTLLGYEDARKILDEMGFDYVSFGAFHFEDDLQYEDAVPMILRLLDLAKKNQVEFGVKITNTFPVDNPKDVLPKADEMYMSGRSLFPVSLAVARKLTEEFDGKLRISFSGGADVFNIKDLISIGIWPVTMATTLLKPGGYGRFHQIVTSLQEMKTGAFEGVDVKGISALSEKVKKDIHHLKSVKPAPSRKRKEKVPLVDCFANPCQAGCPIHQDIPTYVELTSEGRYEEALEVILEKNPLPFITGTICSHRCMNRCTRNFYEESVKIRDVKLVAAKNGFDAVIGKLPEKKLEGPAKAAIVGGGPAGMAAAYFLGRAGIKSVLYEEKESLGGIVRHVIPNFRIGEEAIKKDADILEKMGAEVLLSTKALSLRELKRMGYTYVIYATGAWKHGAMDLEGEKTLPVLEFLETYKKEDGNLNLGQHVVIIGGGNTAMDAARAAKRVAGVEDVTIVYRRTRRYMPAEEEELMLAMEEGIQFEELKAPKRFLSGVLTCEKMELGKADSSGRRSPVPTGEVCEIKADTVILAIGEKVDVDFFENMGVTVEKGSVLTSEENVFTAGDVSRGPATVVEAIADAKVVCDLICLKEELKEDEKDFSLKLPEKDLRKKRAILSEASALEKEGERCLNCSQICECCVDVCPNRANISIRTTGGKLQIIHMDGMCNECGNCMTFCPYDSAPYKEKLTYFNDRQDYGDSQNDGFYVNNKETGEVTLRLGTMEKVFLVSSGILPQLGGVEEIIKAFLEDYSYLI